MARGESFVAAVSKTDAPQAFEANAGLTGISVNNTQADST
jgi:hypothetical protein